MEINGAPSSANLTSNDVDAETAAKLRGDAIGETMYSQVFVIKTLLQFSDMKWSRKFEDDLCFMWDMSEETDVCKFLLELSYPSLACAAVLKYEEPRFIEIVIGIFANVVCSKTEKNIKTHDIKTILDIINSEDPLILIQVMRFIHAITFMYAEFPFIGSETVIRLSYVLENSVNKELLLLSLKVLAALTHECTMDLYLIDGDLINTAIIAYRTLQSDELDNTEFKLSTQYFLEISCSICGYITKKLTVRPQITPYIDTLTHELAKLLKYCTEHHDIEEDELYFYMWAMNFICTQLDLSYSASIVAPLSCLVQNLGQEDLKEGMHELLCYFISVADPSLCYMEPHWRDIKTQLGEIEAAALNYDFVYLDNLRLLLSLLD